MKKYIAGTVLSLLMVFSLTGCGGSSGNDLSAETSVSDEAASSIETNETKSPETDFSDEAVSETTAKKEEEHKIDISEIDWNTSASVVDGTRIAALNYTNNSSYPIIGLEIKFTQKPELTDEQLSILNDIKEEFEFDDEDIKDLYVTGESRKYAEPGQTVSDAHCYINGFWGFENAGLFDAMRPDMATIEYIDTDGKSYKIYYDFINDSYGKSTDGGKEVLNWSDSELASMLPKPEAYKIDISIDRDDWFDFDAYGISPDEYREYVRSAEASGFTDGFGGFDGGNTFFASNDDVSLTVLYSSDEEKMDVSFNR